MFSSTIIPTIGRSTLSRAVRSVLDQDFITDDFEVIVVNDSGKQLPQADWQLSERVRIIETDHRERSVARNTGAAIAKGRYLHFLDDDDLLLPGALSALWELDQRKGEAIWLSGSYETVDNNGNLIERIDPENWGNNFALLVAGEGVPFQASLLNARYFFKVGCFDPKITGVEDRDLGRRFVMVGTICHTNALVARIRIGVEGSTTNWSILAEAERASRENAFNLYGSFSRLWDSAKTCVWHGQVRRNYWHGRVYRAYVASMVWNLKRGHWLLAVSRGAAALVFMSWRIFTADFWRGVRQIDLPADRLAWQEIPSAQPLGQSEPLPVIKGKQE